jgi:hypothetical protein
MDESLDANGCPKSAIFLNDDGRMGNQFFEYLQARVFTRQVNRGLFVRRTLNDKFASYFQGHSNPTLESVAQLKQVCGKKVYKDFDMSRKMELPKTLRKQPHIILKRNLFSVHRQEYNGHFD